MNRDARAAVLAALREVYDGSWTRHVGTDGGRTLSWEGRSASSAAAPRPSTATTPSWARWANGSPSTGSPSRPRRAGARGARATPAARGDARRTRGRSCRRPRPAPHTPARRTDAETDQLIALATFVVRARSAVERDGYSREIELVPGSEAPTRLVIVLARLLDGLDAIGCDRDRRVRASSPRPRSTPSPPSGSPSSTTLHAEDDLDTNAIAEAVRHPAQTTRRALEGPHRPPARRV